MVPKLIQFLPRMDDEYVAAVTDLTGRHTYSSHSAYCMADLRREIHQAHPELYAAMDESIPACQLCGTQWACAGSFDEIDVARCPNCDALYIGGVLACRDCHQPRPDDERVRAGMKCGECAY